jgi:hypothetical protein
MVRLFLCRFYFSSAGQKNLQRIQNLWFAKVIRKNIGMSIHRRLSIPRSVWLGLSLLVIAVGLALMTALPILAASTPSDVPELIYYTFDNPGGATVLNQASAPVGTNPAPVLGQTIGGTGQFGSALIGTGASANTDFVDTGWATNLGAGSWTISLWSDTIPITTSTFYMFGDSTARGLRAFTGGAAIALLGPRLSFAARSANFEAGARDAATYRMYYGTPSALIGWGAIQHNHNWANASMIRTPGMTGAPGKCPWKYGSFIVTFLIATTRRPGSSSTTRSTRRNG